MRLSFRISIAISLSVILIAGMSYSQDGQEQPELSTSEQQTKSDHLPVPLPILIIETEEASEARLRAANEDQQRQIDDLAAQQGMNESTRLVAVLAAIQTFLLAAGTAILIWTLFATRAANRAAQLAVEITRENGIAQNRAYVGVAEIKVTGIGYRRTPEVHWKLSNFGNTPAYELRYRTIAYFGQMHQSPVIRFSDDRGPVSGGVVDPGGVNADRYILGDPIIDEVWDAMVGGVMAFYFAAYVTYRDHTKKTRRSIVFVRFDKRSTGFHVADNQLTPMNKCDEHNKSS